MDFSLILISFLPLFPSHSHFIHIELYKIRKTKNKEINAVRRRKPKDSKKTNSCAYIVRVKTSYKNLTDTREREKGNIKKQTNKKYYYRKRKRTNDDDKDLSFY